MKHINKKIIIVAILLAGVTTYFFNMYMKQLENTKYAAMTATVVVATKDIDPGVRIDASMVNEMKLDIRYINTNAIKNKNKVIGKFVEHKILAGEQVIDKRIALEGREQLNYMIPEGMRGVTLSVNEVSGIGYMIKPGNYVDVIVNMDLESEKLNGTEVQYSKVTKYLLQNLQVLTVGTERYKDNIADGTQVNTYTLSVEAKDVEKLIFADQYGMIRLVLRPIEDKEIINSQGIHRRDITPPTR